MAMVLDAFASYVADLLKQVAQDEVGMLLGVSSEIDKMGAKLGDLQAFLADADRRRITDQLVQEWVTELKGAMYDATDIQDLCQLRVMERGPSMGMGCCSPLLFCLQNPLFAHDIGSCIKALNQRLDGIKKRSAAFSFVNLGSYEDRRGRVQASQLSASRETSGELNRASVVGEKIEEDTRKLVETLTEKEGNSDSIMVAAIVGVGGIGKTTLAKKVFNDVTIKDKFDKTIWLSVNQDYNEAELLRRAITETGGDHRQAGDAKATLQRTLKDALNGHKLLLVMDDVWSDGAWEGVLETPLVNAAAPGSRVLVTTRHDTVARGMKAVSPYHHVDKLGPEDAWSLLRKQKKMQAKAKPTEKKRGPDLQRHRLSLPPLRCRAVRSRCRVLRRHLHRRDAAEEGLLPAPHLHWRVRGGCVPPGGRQERGRGAAAETGRRRREQRWPNGQPGPARHGHEPARPILGTARRAFVPCRAGM